MSKTHGAIIAIVPIRDIGVPAIGFGKEMQQGRMVRVHYASDQISSPMRDTIVASHSHPAYMVIHLFVAYIKRRTNLTARESLGRTLTYKVSILEQWL